MILAAPELLDVLEELLSVPMSVDEATLPAGCGPDDAPDVVVNMSIAWARIRKARESVAKVTIKSEGVHNEQRRPFPGWY